MLEVFAVVLLGGKGKRLRPLSTNARPKAFLSVAKDRRTMFKVTVERIKKIIPKGNILVSANKAHRRLVKKDFPTIDNKNLILEPISRNTAPAIGLVATLLKKRFKDAVIAVVPADQYIIDETRYLDAIKKGINFARGKDCLLVLGLRPAYPATGFGYVKIKIKNQKSKIKDIYKVEKFVEKPDLKTAQRFIKDGRYLWNAGAFVFRVTTLLKAIRVYAPEIFNLLAKINNEKDINKVYRNFPDISIDYAVMEKADNLYCAKGTYRWRDIGSFEVLKEVLERESRDFIERNGKVIKIL